LRIIWYQSRFVRDLEAIGMGKALKRENMEGLRDINRQIQEESRYWRQKADELEKEFAKHLNSFTTMREELDKHTLQHLQLEDKFTQVDNWQEERFTEVIAQMYQDFIGNEEALKKLQATIQETK
jgi:hypothetical protein